MPMWGNHNDIVWLRTEAEGQQGGILMLSLILVCISYRKNSRYVGDLGRHGAHWFSVLSTFY